MRNRGFRFWSDLPQSACHSFARLIVFLTVALWLPVGALFAAAQGPGQPTPPTGKDLYQAACVACHGPDGKGESRERVGFETPLPDFTDCRFTAREPDSDWSSIIHNGGPARGFSEIMPAFGDALSDDEIERIIAYLRSFCQARAWPRGDLNLPRPLVTEKAFPEDETVLTTTVAAEGPGAVTSEIVYERRFAARNEIDLDIPVSALRVDSSGWRGGVGDVALGFKRALYHNLERGSIFSIAGEAVLPTGNKAKGVGKGYTTFEPFVAFGQILPSDGFFHFQSGIEVPRDSKRAAKEAFWRAVLGRSFTQGKGFGRAWSPMIELLGARELEAGANTEWDLLPQIQVSLSTRQHILADFGVRVPVSKAGPRVTQIIFYLLWDWFDGGLREGW